MEATRCSFTTIFWYEIAVNQYVMLLDHMSVKVVKKTFIVSWKITFNMAKRFLLISWLFLGVQITLIGIFMKKFSLTLDVGIIMHRTTKLLYLVWPTQGHCSTGDVDYAATSNRQLPISFSRLEHHTNVLNFHQFLLSSICLSRLCMQSFLSNKFKFTWTEQDA